MSFLSILGMAILVQLAACGLMLLYCLAVDGSLVYDEDQAQADVDALIKKDADEFCLRRRVRAGSIGE
jgi:hypothetical protein